VERSGRLYSQAHWQSHAHVRAEKIKGLVLKTCFLRKA
jgi:hypothetical protein